MFQRFCNHSTGLLGIVVALQIEPALTIDAEIGSKAQDSVGGNTAFTLYDFVELAQGRLARTVSTTVKNRFRPVV